ncbi:hypothetical protein COV18_06105 [Candidatus Woesearchaeota archaeon CG10_big_fil_rev_8_21_14_0_10_37_12]|nr:MAG: hypothetical protein COV18_06105 [Candidatus Woesearchaeota archaeon CG10_big_fil_rev_8_21_14_0_10_37_12]
MLNEILLALYDAELDVFVEAKLQEHTGELYRREPLTTLAGWDDILRNEKGKVSSPGYFTARDRESSEALHQRSALYFATQYWAVRQGINATFVTTEQFDAEPIGKQRFSGKFFRRQAERWITTATAYALKSRK